MSQSHVRSLRILRGSYITEPAGEARIQVNRDQNEIERDDMRRLRVEQELHKKISDLESALVSLQKTADEQIQVAFKQGEKVGFQTGHKQGLEEGMSTAVPSISQLQKLTRTVESGISKVWDDSRDAIIDTILEISRRIVGSAAEHYTDIAREITVRAIKTVRDQTHVTICVNAQDIDSLKGIKTELAMLTEGTKRIEIVERPSVPPGGVIIETNAGQLDARLDEQMKAVEAILRPEWSTPTPEVFTEPVDSPNEAITLADTDVPKNPTAIPNPES